MPYYYDSTYLLVIAAFLLTLFASMGVKSTFNKYSKVANQRGITGAQAVRNILDSNGLYDVQIEHIKGNLTDHFDPRAGVIRLSDSVYNSTSVAAIGVGAHEAGHAIQHSVGYVPIKVRNSIIPVVNLSSTLSMPIFFIGLIAGIPALATIGAILFAAVLVFQLVTLPVEFNASRRALKIIQNSNMMYDDEVDKAAKVLRAAAMTYVAAAASSALQLLRLLMIANKGRSRRD